MSSRSRPSKLLSASLSELCAHVSTWPENRDIAVDASGGHGDRVPIFFYNDDEVPQRVRQRRTMPVVQSWQGRVGWKRRREDGADGLSTSSMVHEMSYFAGASREAE